MDLFGDLPAPKGSDVPKATGPATSAATITGTAAEAEATTVTAEVGPKEPASKRARSGDDDAQGPTLDAAVVSSGAAPAPSPVAAQAQGWRVGLRSAHCGIKGRRQTMEDAHLALDAAACRLRCPTLAPGTRVAIYGIFDGHGGRSVADFVAAELPTFILARLAASTTLANPAAVVECLERAFADCDDASQAAARARSWADGCCAVVLVVVDDMAFVANMGDSR